MATHSSTPAWKIPWTEEPGRLQSMGSLRVGHNWATSLSLFTFMPWRRKWQPTPLFLPGESQGRGARWATVYGVTQSRTRLKWLSRVVRVGMFSIKLRKSPFLRNLFTFYNELFIMDFEYFQMLFCASGKIIWFFLFSLLTWWVILIKFLAYPE